MSHIKAVNDDTNSSSINWKGNYSFVMDRCLLTFLSLRVDFHYTLKIITDVSFSLINAELGTTDFIHFEI